MNQAAKKLNQILNAALQPESAGTLPSASTHLNRAIQAHKAGSTPPPTATTPAKGADFKPTAAQLAIICRPLIENKLRRPMNASEQASAQRLATEAVHRGQPVEAQMQWVSSFFIA